MVKNNWVFAFSSTIGSAHITEALPCQDYCKVESYDGFNISIVADGAGSCENSHLGAKQAVEFCNFHFPNLVRSRGWLSGNLPTNDSWNEEAKLTFKRVRDDLENFSINESIEFRSLSCTLIVVISFIDDLLVTHIGDGRAGYCDKKSDWSAMITPFKGEEANQTVFVTSDIYDDTFIDRYIQSLVIGDGPTAFCLMSDGCEKSAFQCNFYNPETQQFYDPNKPFPDFFNNNIKILKQMVDDGKGQEEVNDLWERFLISGTDKLKVETDDKTLILAVRYS
jgi:hypothetical protein